MINISFLKELVKLSGPECILTCKFNLDHGRSDQWFKKFETKHNYLKWPVPQTIHSVRVNRSTEYIIDDFFIQV